MLAGCLMRAMCPHGMNVRYQQALDDIRAIRLADQEDAPREQ